MTNCEKEDKRFKSDKWLYYQDVKVSKLEIKPNEEDKKKVEEFRKFIDNKEKDAKNKN